MRQAIHAQQIVLGSDHPDVIMSVSVLATRLQELHQFEESERLHRQAMEAVERELDAEHPLAGECVGRIRTHADGGRALG